MQHFKNKIENYFMSSKKKIYTLADLSYVLDIGKSQWGLAAVTTVEDFIHFLTTKNILNEVEISMPNRTTYRYTYGNITEYEVALSLDKKAYISHYSAIFLHGLTDNIPKSIYINIEQREKFSNPENELEQSNIDRAFSRPMRKTNQIAEMDAYNCNIYMLNGKNTDNAGVEDYELDNGSIIPVTNLERTLIDITVRPSYAGGVQEVLNAYRSAKNKVSTNALLKLLKELNYVYPYHQAIGFYMEKCDYKESSLKLVERLGIKYNFYLTYEMKEKNFSDRWKLYTPKGL